MKYKMFISKRPQKTNPIKSEIIIVKFYYIKKKIY